MRSPDLNRPNHSLPGRSQRALRCSPESGPLLPVRGTFACQTLAACLDGSLVGCVLLRSAAGACDVRHQGSPSTLTFLQPSTCSRIPPKPRSGNTSVVARRRLSGGEDGNTRPRGDGDKRRQEVFTGVTAARLLGEEHPSCTVKSCNLRAGRVPVGDIVEDWAWGGDC